MKKTLIALVVAVAPIPAAFAASGNTINFVGEVTDQTCNVAINGSNANPTVLLPTVSASELDTANKVAGKTNFTISVSGCKAETADKAIKTVFVGNQLSGGNLQNTATGTSAATLVALQLFDPAKSSAPFDLSKGGHTASGLTLKKGEENASYDFAVQYFSEGKATAGAVNGNVQYMLSYQ
ncbi:fimbrial protein [Paraburkholderia sp.]|uniref:fimbrial protein n=1 Tax=Paraburkholderia sp. TaxID=1926495 RepID=UPI0025FDED38|nr:fimbrial protein [Paraburkholderia sp.]